MCILVTCGAAVLAVLAFDADFVEAYFDCLLLLHIITFVSEML